MTSVLVSHHCNARFGNDFAAAATREGIALELLILPSDPESRIDAAIAARARAALIAALRCGRLAGAYLDVFAQEPLPPESPLWNMQNVVVTPHNSAASACNEVRVNAIFLENLKRWTRNEPLVNEVTRN